MRHLTEKQLFLVKGYLTKQLDFLENRDSQNNKDFEAVNTYLIGVKNEWFKKVEALIQERKEGSR